MSRGIQPRDFNSYGSRRGNDLVMTRGTFANVRIKNLMVPGTEGGVTRCFANGKGEEMSIFDAAMKYAETHTPLVILAGHEYGTGSSRDWAAKGTRLLGVKAVVAASFERIHRSNLVGMGVLPLQFPDGTTAQSLGLDGSEVFSIIGLSEKIKPGETVRLEIEGEGQQKRSVPVKVRIDTPIEIDYYRHGGILPFCLSLGVVPVFVPPREPGFQAMIEGYNGQWQAKVWARFTHGSLVEVQERSSRYVAALRRVRNEG